MKPRLPTRGTKFPFCLYLSITVCNNGRDLDESSHRLVNEGQAIDPVSIYTMSGFTVITVFFSEVRTLPKILRIPKDTEPVKIPLESLLFIKQD